MAKPKQARKQQKSVDRAKCLAFADDTFSRPPANEWCKRVSGTGALVCRIVLPLDLCRNADSLRRAKPFMMQKLRSDCLEAIRSQLSEFYPELVHEVLRWGGLHVEAKSELSGRPHILAVRFSTRESDIGSNGAKQAIDCLLPPRSRKAPTKRGKKVPAVTKMIHVSSVGLIHDDAPRFAEVCHWSEHAPIRSGFQLIEVWTGGATIGKDTKDSI